MKTFKIIGFAIVLLFPDLSLGQIQRDFGDILQTYYLHKDKDLLEKTIEVLNSPQTEYKRFKPILTGFFGALFSNDVSMKNNFSSNLNKIENPDFKELIEYLTISNIDSIYSKTSLSPEYNDMNWASFFATGNTNFLDNIIANISLAENRIDRNLYLTGASAKWSLCSNARNDKIVKNHLAELKENKKAIKEILKKEPYEFKQEMITVIKEQRAKGLWTEE
jgi:hypothetical protein